MHTPAGHEQRDGIVYAADWWAIIFNPSMPYRLAHMLLASGLTVAFLIAGLSAWRWLRHDRTPAVATGLRFGLTLGALLIPVQILAGDMHGLNTLEHQPAKVAAMEGNWETRGNVPLLLFALPDEAARENRLEIGIPSMASVILKHDPQGVVPGLNDFVAEDGTPLHPPVAAVFWSFRIMVGIGMLMLLVSWGGSWLLLRRGVEGLPRPALWGLVGMSFAGWGATLAGWYTTEIGRQPWLVHGVLTVKDALGDVAAGMVLSTLIAYLVVYALLIAAYLGVLFHLAAKAGQPARPAPLPSLQPAE
jgi:cytochrome d ubiquinol oxidase subunit I